MHPATLADLSDLQNATGFLKLNIILVEKDFESC
jgi:hypothetical protein